MSDSPSPPPATDSIAAALPPGFRASGLWAGIKPADRGADLGVIVADRPGPAAARFTRNELLGAHVPLCRDALAASSGQVRALLVNSGNANCATGSAGRDDAARLQHLVAERLDCRPAEVLVMSTGVIGARLPIDRMLEAVPRLVDSALAATGDPAGLQRFAESILTTDTATKLAGSTASTPGSVCGIAKGSGMIHPDLATMLAFLLTDVTANADDLDRVLGRAVPHSFHRLSVDGDTSPNDTVLLWSSGTGPAIELQHGVTQVATSLCQQIAADGEGASRLVTIEVRGARSEADATHVGRQIATSPLTKTAIAGRDPNWGRILSVAGRAGVPVSMARAKVWIGPVIVFETGQPRPEREAEASRHLVEQRAVVIGVDLASGSHEADVWTCDLTAEYVAINADYRT